MSTLQKIIIGVSVAITGIGACLLGLPVHAAAANHAVIQIRGEGTALQELLNPISISGSNGSASAAADLPTGMLQVNVSSTDGTALARAQFSNDRLTFSGPPGATTARVRFTMTIGAAISLVGSPQLNSNVLATNVFTILRPGAQVADSASITYANSWSQGAGTRLPSTAGAGQISVMSVTASDFQAVLSVEVDVPLGQVIILSSLIDAAPGGTVTFSGSAQVAVGMPSGYSFTSEGMLLINQPPVADAGADQSTHAGSVVTLDGSRSRDPNNRLPLTYQWQITSGPAFSTAALSDPTAVNPSIMVDKLGDYTISLVVTNAGGIQSAPDDVKVSTTNTAPVAVAGPDQSITLLGTTVQLDGSQSYDADGDPFTYEWTLTPPHGSLAGLSDRSAVKPTFVADVHADYVISLVVTDILGAQSKAASVTVSFLNVKPVANAGLDQSVVLGETATLDARGSSDANGDPLTSRWAFVSTPGGSSPEITQKERMVATFAPDKVGTYVVQLVVNDGIVDSDPVSIQVQVLSGRTATDAVRAVEAAVASLDPSVFRAPAFQRLLLRALLRVLADIEAGRDFLAWATLEAILLTTDGCAKTGAPQRTDVIRDCGAQLQVYNLLLPAIDLVRSLVRFPTFPQ